MTLRTYLASALCSALVVLSGCAQVIGIEDWTLDESCNAKPWSCPAGQTCWANAVADKFECFNGGAGQAGSSCQNYAGEPTCGEDLGCLQLEGQANGICSPYCHPQDPAHGCPMGTACTAFIFPMPAGDVTLYLCSP